MISLPSFSPKTNSWTDIEPLESLMSVCVSCVHLCAELAAIQLSEETRPLVAKINGDVLIYNSREG